MKEFVELIPEVLNSNFENLEAKSQRFLTNEILRSFYKYEEILDTLGYIYNIPKFLQEIVKYEVSESECYFRSKYDKIYRQYN